MQEENQISPLLDERSELAKSEEQKEKCIRKSEQSPGDVSDNTRIQTSILGVPEGKERKKSLEVFF